VGDAASLVAGELVGSEGGGCRVIVSALPVAACRRGLNLDLAVQSANDMYIGGGECEGDMGKGRTADGEDERIIDTWWFMSRWP